MKKKAVRNFEEKYLLIRNLRKTKWESSLQSWRKWRDSE